jgi:hypothetical protein
MVIWLMRTACWILKATNTPSEYVIPIAFPLQQWLHESAPILHYTHIACLLEWFPCVCPILLFCFQGVKVKMDDQGNILVKRVSKSNVYVKSTSTGDETSIGNDVLKQPNCALELEKPVKVRIMCHPFTKAARRKTSSLELHRIPLKSVQTSCCFFSGASSCFRAMAYQIFHKYQHADSPDDKLNESQWIVSKCLNI